MSSVRLDLILRAAEILTLDDDRPAARAMGVLHGRIVGFDDELDGLEAREERDLGDAVIVPGLIDAHCHTTWWGLGLDAVDLGSVRGLDDLYAALEREHARLAAHPAAWLQATGFNQAHHGGAFPSLERLDAITGSRPLLIRHTSGHASITNTATLRALGAFEPGFADPSGGRIVRRADGTPTGLVEEAAQQLVQSMLLPYSIDRIADALDRATRRYAARGITSFTEAGIGGGWIGHSGVELAAYQRAAASGRLHARAQVMPAIDALVPLHGHAEDFSGLGDGAGLTLGVGFGFGDERVRLGHVKVFLDGSLLGQTAAVTEDYCGHAHERGYLLDDPDAYREHVLAAASAGWPLALHAIGDAAIDLALDLITECQGRFGRAGAPHRIEHFGIARPDQVTRAAGLGIAVTPQAGFIGPIGDQMAERVGERRAAWLYRGRSLVDAGVILAGSSDLPVVDDDLLRGMQSAVDRRTSSGVVLGPDEGLTPEQALRTHTAWAAAATGQLAELGTLRVGKLADCAVLSGSPITAARIDDLEVLATFVGGTCTFDAADAAPTR